MTHQNFKIAVRSFCRRRPFQPFLIEFFSGARFLVTHPEVVQSHNGLISVTSSQREHHLFEAASVCQVLDAPQTNPSS
jgi:hypothetical protein